MQDSAHATLRGPFYRVLGLVQWYLPTISQGDVVHGPLPFTRVDTTNVISVWHDVGAHQRHLPGGLQGSTKIVIVSQISSVVLQGNWTKFPVGFLSASGVGRMQPHPSYPAGTITPRN
jgi:hypothetical protein